MLPVNTDSATSDNADITPIATMILNTESVDSLDTDFTTLPTK